MKSVNLLVLLLLSISSYSQPLKEKLTSAIIKIEKENYTNNPLNKRDPGNSKAGEPVPELKITSVDVDIFKYSLITLKAWWKSLWDIHNSWGTMLHDLALDLTEGGEKLDSAKRQAFEEQFKATYKAMEDKDTSEFSERKYFKEKYETTDTTIKVYEVWYKVDLKANMGGGYQTDTIRIALYQKDLAEVKSFE